MGKFSLSKKTIRKNLAVCILYHDNKIDLFALIESIKNKNVNIIILLDGLKKIKNQKKIKSKFKNIKIIPVKKHGIPYCRNFCIKYCIKKNYNLLIFLDSDVIAKKNIIENHLKYHNQYKNIPVIAGSVVPTFLRKKTNIFTKIDGILSWLGHIPEEKEKIIKEPYHLATVNMSIKIKVIKKFKIFFDLNLPTGEDIKFCRDIRRKGFDILKIPKAEVKHFDRENLKEVISHQANWGRHQFYTVYKYNFIKMGIMFNILFLLFFPFFFPFISIFTSFITIYPWLKKSSSYIKYFFLVYIFIVLKSIYSYLECYKNLFKELKYAQK